MSDNMNTKLEKLWGKFQSKIFRDSFVDSHASTTVAAQIFTMREDREWTQSDLAAATGMAQSRISLLEDPSYDRMNIGTLKRIATAFDVGLLVSFVPFSEVLRHAADDSDDRFSVRPFSQDFAPVVGNTNWSATALVYNVDRTAKVSVTKPTENREIRIVENENTSHANVG
ncbi:helix-turn-helix domain-containing protein [Mesorhizobium sp. PAMC28654]|uniref:helix-turn-helix domain-containing protein n=1 Tax=Mesorhizobium sp. PAMC28654 TaxID=2880934 RepID=UPI001D0BA8B1|nr:XRE family transcriptional regulator [Mesorhizobium sp. PAMC28654]UDL91700.1 helix-turn-helix domain-containing protein [Mesorhizobium sp. PAMC28654]